MLKSNTVVYEYPSTCISYFPIHNHIVLEYHSCEPINGLGAIIQAL